MADGSAGTHCAEMLRRPLNPFALSSAGAFGLRVSNGARHRPASRRCAPAERLRDILMTVCDQPAARHEHAAGLQLAMVLRDGSGYRRIALDIQQQPGRQRL